MVGLASEIENPERFAEPKNKSEVVLKFWQTSHPRSAQVCSEWVSLISIPHVVIIRFWGLRRRRILLETTGFDPSPLALSKFFISLHPSFERTEFLLKQTNKVIYSGKMSLCQSSNVEGRKGTLGKFYLRERQVKDLQAII